MPLSAIHSYIARSRYGRLEVMICVVIERTRWPSSQKFFFFGQATRETRIAEDALAVFVDHTRFAWQVDIEAAQAPDQRRERAIGEAQLRIQEKLRRLEQRQARKQRFMQALARGVGWHTPRGHPLRPRQPA